MVVKISASKTAGHRPVCGDAEMRRWFSPPPTNPAARRPPAADRPARLGRHVAGPLRPPMPIRCMASPQPHL